MVIYAALVWIFINLTCTGKRGKRFELKKWNAVAMWTWDIGVDTCAICRNNIMDMCIEAQANPDGALGIDYYLGGLVETDSFHRDLLASSPISTKMALFSLKSQSNWAII